MRGRMLSAVAVALAFALAAGAAPALAGQPTGQGEAGPEIAAIRAATAQFKHFDETALAAAGYVLKLPDGDGVTFCIDKPGEGGMGIHYVNPEALAPGFDTALPEVLVYEPDEKDRLRLVAVEFVVFAGDLPPGGHHPMFLGQHLHYAPGPGEPGANRYGLPAFYALHVWLWKHNPSGMFADYNPRVTCA